MQIEIKAITPAERADVIEMMRVFYASDAVFTNGSDDIFESDVDACLSGSPYLRGYCFFADGVLAGYAMTAHSFSTEFGKPCVWIEDIYVKAPYRRLGIGKQFFDLLDSLYPDCVLRLEAEEENASAVALYKSRGFEVLPYLELKK